jgi:hypothetical protein
MHRVISALLWKPQEAPTLDLASWAGTQRLVMFEHQGHSKIQLQGKKDGVPHPLASVRL